MASRVLVVDDSPTIRRVVSAILERAGYEVTLASDGEDALEVLSSGEVKPDLVLVDFVMPRMNGFQLCRAIRETPEIAAMPIVLMSAKGDRIRDQFVQQTGALDAITKPFDAQALVAVVENALRRAHAGQTSSARLPDIGDEEPSEEIPAEPETRRAHVAHIVATKLAHLVARVMAERPGASPGEIAGALTDRLARDGLLEMVEVVRDLQAPSGGGAVVLSGDLGVVPIGAVLQLLQVENQTGVLLCQSGAVEIVATLRDGRVDLVQSTNAGDEFLLGRFFVEEGILTPELLAEAMARVDRESSPSLPQREAPTVEVSVRDAQGVDSTPPSQVQVRSDVPSAIPSEPAVTLRTPDTLRDEDAAVDVRELAARFSQDAHTRATVPGIVRSSAPTTTRGKRLLGSALLGYGMISESQLRDALTRQSSELLYEVLRWQRGRFEFRSDPPSAAAGSARLGLPVATVVMEGFRRVDEWRVLERTIGNFGAVLVRDDIALASFDVGALPAKETAVLALVDGERTVRTLIAASHMSSFDACRVLAQFLEARVLRRKAS